MIIIRFRFFFCARRPTAFERRPVDLPEPELRQNVQREVFVVPAHAPRVRRGTSVLVHVVSETVHAKGHAEVALGVYPQDFLRRSPATNRSGS